MSWISEAMKVHGLCTEDELMFLFRMVRDRAPPQGYVVELGTFQGRSTIFLCEAVTGDRVVGIDNFAMQHHGQNDMATTRANLLKFRHRPRLITGSSHVFPDVLRDQKIAAVVIDTDHRAGPLRQELATWIPFLEPNGLVALHDYGSSKWPEVTQVADEYFTVDQWEKFGPVGMMLVHRRKF